MVCRCAYDFGVILPLYFNHFFFYFFDLVFSGSISIIIDTLWVQLLLEVFTDHLETTRTCSTWSENVHVFFGLSCRYRFFNFLLFSTYFF